MVQVYAKYGDGALVQQWLETLPCWSQQLSSADSCSPGRLNAGFDLDNGLKGTRGHKNGQLLSSADSCLLMATDGSNDGVCHNGLTDGSSNSSKDYECGVAHNTLRTLAILPTFPACKLTAHFNGSWTKTKSTVHTSNFFGNEILR